MGKCGDDIVISREDGEVIMSWGDAVGIVFFGDKRGGLKVGI